MLENIYAGLLVAFAGVITWFTGVLVYKLYKGHK